MAKPVLNRGKGHLPRAASKWSQSYRWPSLGQGHIAALHSTCCPAGPPRSFPSKLLSWYGGIPGIYWYMGDCSSPDVGLHISPGIFSKRKILYFGINSEAVVSKTEKNPKQNNKKQATNNKKKNTRKINPNPKKHPNKQKPQKTQTEIKAVLFL